MKILNNQEIEEIREMYKNNISCYVIAKKFNIHRGAVFKLVCDMPRKIEVFNKKLEEKTPEIIKFYQSGMTMKKIAKITKITRKKISEILNKNNIKLKTKSQYLRRFSVDENFFEKIDSPLKAQIFGFICADGCVHDNTLAITISECDRDYLFNIKNALKSASKIKIRKSKNPPFEQDGVTLKIHSKKIKEDLSNLGCSSNKSLTLVFPTIQKNLIKYFIKGYFEGDGGICTSINKNRKYFRISISCSKIFSHVCKKYISELANINENNIKIYDHGKIDCIFINAQVDVIKFLNWIYEDNINFNMSRKYDLYIYIKDNYRPCIITRNKLGQFEKCYN